MLSLFKELKEEKTKKRKILKIISEIEKLKQTNTKLNNFKSLFKDDEDKVLNYISENQYLTQFICDDSNMNVRYYDLRNKVQSIINGLEKVKLLEIEISKQTIAFGKEVDEFKLDECSIKIIEYTNNSKQMFSSILKELGQHEDSWSTVELVESLSRTKVIGLEIKDLLGVSNSEQENKKNIGVNVL
jgi:hypothetical protein